MKDHVTKVTSKEPIDGTTKKRTPSRGSRTNRKRVVDEHSITVDERVMTAAKGLLRKGQRIEIVSATEVWVVNR